MGLGDFFPDKLKDDFAKRSIELGKALLIEIPEFNVSYKKYMIIIATNDSHIGSVIINTEINENFAWNDNLKKLHLLILKKEHQFLDYDSFVDCSKIYKKELKGVCDAISKDPKIVVGNVTDDLLRQIHIRVTQAETISKKVKKEFGFL